ncbi:MAG TPA: hypothetical protein VJY62_01815 [Bacteroidia bacterium]|nr:hypothetical protein [Bacteroidia bacterium]
MKKLFLLMLLGSFLFSSCYNRRHGRTLWSKTNHAPVEKVRPS